VLPYDQYSSILMMHTAGVCEILVSVELRTLQYMPDDRNLSFILML